MHHPKKMAILVGGGPAPGINSVISAATIRGVLEGRRGARHPRRLRVAHAGQRRPRDAPHHRRGEPHPLPRRLAHRDRAGQPHQEPRPPREHGDLAAAPERQHAAHHRRRRHRVLRHEARGEGGRAHPRGPRAQDHRQRPRPAGLRRHLRLPDRPPHRRRHREEPDGGREDHVALVLRHRHGPEGRPPGPGHRQGGGGHPHPHPRGVRGAASSSSRCSWTPWWGRSSSA